MFTCPSLTWPTWESLIVEFRGECGYGCRSNGDATFMTALIKAGLEAWHPFALILDLRKMKYEWGDQMSCPLCAGDAYRPDPLDLEWMFLSAYLVERDVNKIPKEFLEFPRACVVSDLNREGLTSLVRLEMRKNPAELLFETLEEALTSVDCQAKRLFKSPQSGTT